MSSQLKPDVVIMDIIMPKFDGIEASKKIKTTTPNIAILILTAYDDDNYVLGRTTSGTLILAEDDRGLAVEIEPPDAQWARDLLVSIRRGDVNQMSFQFTVDEDRWVEENDKTTRWIKSFKRLWDVSPVTFPAYPQTSIEARSALERARAAGLVAGPEGEAQMRALEAARGQRDRLRRRIDIEELAHS